MSGSMVRVMILVMRTMPILVACTLAASLQAQTLLRNRRNDLSTRWELADSLRNPVFTITPYKPVYLLPVVWTSSPNYAPSRENEAVETTNDSIPLDPTELKFQLSLKIKAVQGLFKGNGDLWIGYTQTSRWQIFNSALSRPSVKRTTNRRSCCPSAPIIDCLASPVACSARAWSTRASAALSL